MGVGVTYQTPPSPAFSSKRKLKSVVKVNFSGQTQHKIKWICISLIFILMSNVS